MFSVFSLFKDIEEMDVNLFIEKSSNNVNLTTQMPENEEENEMVSLPIQKYTSLLQKLKEAEDRTKETEEELQQALNDLQQMR